MYCCFCDNILIIEDARKISSGKKSDKKEIILTCQYCPNCDRIFSLGTKSPNKVNIEDQAHTKKCQMLK